MKKRKFENMLEFEKAVNYYLENDLPFSLLEEEYDLSLKERGFLLNRVIDYSGRLDEINENIGGEVSEDYLNIPHNLEEKTPLNHDELTALFKKRDELKKKIRDIQKRVDTSKYDALIKEFALSELEIAKDLSYRIDFSDVIDKDIDEKAIKYYQELYDRYLLINRDRSNYINVSLEDDDEYNKLRHQLASIDDEIVARNIKLANWVIRLYFKRMPFEMEEAQGFALEGLTKAMNGFDVEMGYHFSSYAVKVIKRTIQENFTGLVGLSWRNYLFGLDYKRYVQEYTNVTNEKNVTAEDLYKSNLFGKSLSELKKCEKYANMVTIPFSYLLPIDPLDLRDKKNEMLTTMEDYEETNNYEDAYNTNLNLATTSDELSIYAENKILEDTLRSLLDVLPDDQKRIIKKRYGFEDGVYHSLDQVAMELNTTKDKVNRVDKKIQKFLRHPLQARILHDFYTEKDVYEGSRKNTYRCL